MTERTDLFGQPSGRGNNTLTRYRGHASLWDGVISRLANGLIRLATKRYRAIVQEAITLGLTQLVNEASENPPFTEPLDDEPA